MDANRSGCASDLPTSDLPKATGCSMPPYSLDFGVRLARSSKFDVRSTCALAGDRDDVHSRHSRHTQPRHRVSASILEHAAGSISKSSKMKLKMMRLESASRNSKCSSKLELHSQRRVSTLRKHLRTRKCESQRSKAHLRMHPNRQHSRRSS